MLRNKSFIKYNKIIDNAISEKRNRKENTYERHHIIPKSLGGTNNRSNLVLLTPEEHYICHGLLVDFCKGKHYHKMVFAWNAMNMHDVNGEELIGPSKYQELKEKFVIENRIRALAHFQTEEGKKQAINTGLKNKEFNQTEAGKESTRLRNLKNKEFYQTQEGKTFLNIRGKNQSEYYKSDKGKEWLEHRSVKSKLFYQSKEGKEWKNTNSKRHQGNNHSGIPVMIEGESFKSTSDAARKLDKTWDYINNRIKSNKYPEYIKKDPNAT